MAKTHDDINDTQDKTLDVAVTFSKSPLLSMVVPKNKKFTMCRILKPFIKHFDVLGNALEVIERDYSMIPRAYDIEEPRVPPYTVSHDQMSAPAISIMIFLPEFGRSRAAKVKMKFKKNPWHLHHSIQLQNSKSSNVIGKQEFYFLSRSYPLWSVCTAPQSSRQLRINIFVRRYSAMVEFYRLLTGSEMESSKPGFCIFPLNTQLYSDLSSLPAVQPTESPTTCELALKQCPHINPFPITNAYLTFPVANIVSLSTVLHMYIRPLTSTHHLVYDPDGNPIILYDLSTNANSNRYPIGNSQSSIRAILAAVKGCVMDKASDRSDSQDSGRFSDFDTTCSTELDQCMAQLFPNQRQNKLESHGDRSIPSHGDRSIPSLGGHSNLFVHNGNKSFEERIRQVSIGQLPLLEDKKTPANKERSKKNSDVILASPC